MNTTTWNDGDRRAHQRFDVVGALWGVLELPEPARICNVSSTGMLIDSSAAAAPNSTQVIKVLVDGELVSVSTRVRHVRLSDDEPGRYLIGLEFESLPAPVQASIDQAAAAGELKVYQSVATRALSG